MIQRMLVLVAVLAPAVAAADPDVENEVVDRAVTPITGSPCDAIAATSCRRAIPPVVLPDGSVGEVFRVEHDLGELGFVLAISRHGRTALVDEIIADTSCGMGKCDWLHAGTPTLTRLSQNVLALQVHYAMVHEDSIGQNGKHPMSDFAIDHYAVCGEHSGGWRCRSVMLGGLTGTCHATRWPTERVDYTCSSSGTIVLGD